MNELRIVTLKRTDLQKVLDAFGDNSEFIEIALELSSTEVDQVLWVDNGRFGKDRAYIRINERYNVANL